MKRFALNDYLRLVKSGIILGNSMHYIVGMLLAVPVVWGDVGRGVIGLVATALLIASACMVNNWLDRHYDKAMKRTATRITARGEVTGEQIYKVAGAMALVAMVILWWLVNPLTALLGAIAWVSYSFVYTLSKPYTAWSTIIGTIPGALPAVAGYTAITGQMTVTAWWLFALIVAWQLPHFYAIAVYRRREYQAARVRVLSTIASARTMRLVVVATLVLYVIVAIGMAWSVLTWLAGLILVVLAFAWLWQAWPYNEGRHEQWARRLFGWSMYVSLGLVAVAVAHVAIS